MNSPINTSTASKNNFADESVNIDSSAEMHKQIFSVLVIDFERALRDFLKKGLTPHCTMLKLVSNVEEAAELLKHYHFDLLIAEISGQGPQGVEQLNSLLKNTKSKVIFTSTETDVDTVLAALRMGAVEFLQKPFRMEQILESVQQVTQRTSQKKKDEASSPNKTETIGHKMGGMIGRCEIMKDMCEVIGQIASTPSTVLLEGESGTGKEMVANTIHQMSGRSGLFVPVHCASISPQLLESELFGHAKGAFTGAHQAREGLFHHANGGTLFLDEIGEMPLEMQVKLLRFMEEGTIRRVGENEESPAEVRIICATNRTLAEEVKAGHFREDLFFRINVLLIHLPPLRERSEDIPLLAQHFSEELAPKLKRIPLEFSKADLAFFNNYNWPGNVRELKNVVERSMLLNRSLEECYQTGSTIDCLVPPALKGRTEELELCEVEKNHILKVLNGADGNKSAASRLLGIARKTLERKLKDWNTEL